MAKALIAMAMNTLASTMLKYRLLCPGRLEATCSFNSNEAKNVHTIIFRVRFRFENLFNGDRTLGEQMNTFLNENWKEILDLIRDSISKGLSSIAKSTLKKVFNQVPYKDLFKH